jgi:glycosyltransferase involved in cell wall biosynthesis
MAHDPGRRPSDGGAVTVHLVELDGRGGPYQHTVAVADELDRAGVHVVLHTATDAELMPAREIRVCRCMDWLRDAGRGRRALVAARFLAVTVPRLLRGDGVLHVQGPFKAWLLAILLAAARLRGRRVVFSPHNTFSRHGGWLDALLVRLCARLAHATVVFSDTDAREVSGWGTAAVVSPLLQHLPAVEPARVEAWRERWGAAPVVLFAGQIRRDKRLDVVIEASRRWTRPRRLAIVGKDLGDARRCRELAARVGADAVWDVGYVELDAFTAAVAAADVVVCPYSRASQSGVLAVAAQLGVPTIASDVGGLRELATAVVPRDVDAAGLAGAVDALLAAPPARDGSDPVRATVEAHRRAYGVA